MMNSIDVRIALTVWPALAFTALALPLPGVRSLLRLQFL